MKILQISNGYLEKGLYRHLFTSIAKLGTDNEIFVPVKKRYGKTTDETNVKVVECFNELDRYLFFSKQKKTINSIVSNYDVASFDCIHAHTLFSTGYSAYRLKKKYGIPYIVAIRNTDLHMFLEKHIAFRKIGLDIMLNASFIVCLSSSYKNAVIEKYIPEKHKNDIASKTVVIPNGIDEYYLQNIREELYDIHSPLRVLHVGDIDKNKNILTTVNALEILRNKGIQVEYVLVGDIKDDEVGKAIEKCDYIRCVGRKNKEEIVSIMRDSDVFVMPSHHETFGLVYAEAMSQGLPVIYTKGQGFDGQFKDGEVGYSVYDNDPKNIAVAIEDVIINYKKMQKNCLEQSKLYDWSRIARQYNDLYNILM